MGHDLERLAQAGRSGPGVGVLVELPVVGEVFLAGEGVPQHLDVFPGAGQGPAEGSPIPAFDDLGTGHADTQDQAAL